MSEPAHDPDFYVQVTGPFADSIEGWARSAGLTLEQALDEGVRSPDDGEPYVLVPRHLLRQL